MNKYHKENQKLMGFRKYQLSKYILNSRSTWEVSLKLDTSGSLLMVCFPYKPVCVGLGSFVMLYFEVHHIV